MRWTNRLPSWLSSSGRRPSRGSSGSTGGKRGSPRAPSAGIDARPESGPREDVASASCPAPALTPMSRSSVEPVPVKAGAHAGTNAGSAREGARSDGLPDGRSRPVAKGSPVAERAGAAVSSLPRDPEGLDPTTRATTPLSHRPLDPKADGRRSFALISEPATGRSSRPVPSVAGPTPLRESVVAPRASGSGDDLLG